MAYMINDACISCGACEADCPVECISSGDDPDGDRQAAPYFPGTGFQNGKEDP